MSLPGNVGRHFLAFGTVAAVPASPAPGSRVLVMSRVLNRPQHDLLLWSFAVHNQNGTSGRYTVVELFMNGAQVIDGADLHNWGLFGFDQTLPFLRLSGVGLLELYGTNVDAAPATLSAGVQGWYVDRGAGAGELLPWGAL